METRPKGAIFLRIISIILIVASAILMIFSLIILVLGGAIKEYLGDSSGLLWGLTMLLGAVFGLVAGIIGTKNANRAEKATKCIVWGIIVLVIQLISVILGSGVVSTLSDIGADSAVTSLLTPQIFLGIVLTIPYIIAAFLNKSSAKQ